MNKIKVGFIGTGQICKVSHIPSVVELKDQAIGVALYDHTMEAAARIQKEYLPDAIVCDSLEMLLASGIDAAIISTPNNTHHALTMACLKAGIHVLIEKPMASTLEEADEMIATARERGLVLQVNQSARFNRDYSLLRQIIGDGAIGKPVHIRCLRASTKSPDIAWSPGAKWFLSKSARGGIIMDIAVHMADLMSWYFGPVDWLFANHQIRNEASEVPDHLSTMFTFENGATGILELSWNFPRNVNLLEIYGEKGTLRIGSNPAGPEIATGDGDFTLLETCNHQSPTSQACFIEAVTATRAPVSPVEIGRNALALCLAIEESGEARLRIKPATTSV